MRDELRAGWPTSTWLLPALLLLGGCASAGPVVVSEPPSHRATIPSSTSSVLDATLWMQTSVEYGAVARQTWALAGSLLPGALQDTTWTAVLEQEPGYGALPPAVIVDVDETMLDNSPYAARLLEADEGYSDESWGRWVEQAKARPVPGAVGFARLARDLGVEVFYVTNRDASLEEATRRNLLEQGFPPSQAEDGYLFKNEREDWGSDKTTRRAFVAKGYRVLLVAGDDMNDFVSGARSGLEQRAELAELHRSKWGTLWLTLPNPTYGSWESALLFGEPDLSGQEVFERKMDALDPAEGND